VNHWGVQFTPSPYSSIINLSCPKYYPLSNDMKARVMHAHLKVGDADLMFSGTYVGMTYQPGNSIQIAIHPEDEGRAREIFAALEDGRQVIIPLQKTDWTPLYGMVQDKFGVYFNLNVQGEQPQYYQSDFGSVTNKASCS
jgi:PhnB protein